MTPAPDRPSSAEKCPGWNECELNCETTADCADRADKRWQGAISRLETYQTELEGLTSFYDAGAKAHLRRKYEERAADIGNILSSFIEARAEIASLHARIASLTEAGNAAGVADNASGATAAKRLENSVYIAVKRGFHRINIPRADLVTVLSERKAGEAALKQIAGSHWERVGYCQTDIEDEPDMTAEEAMNLARAALAGLEEHNGK